MDSGEAMDWTGCDLVEAVPGRCSGLPTVRGTRIFPETIIQYFDRGASVEEILEDYPSLTGETIRAVFAFADSRRGQLAS